MNNPFRQIPGIKVIKNEPLSKHTSFHIGGNADYLIKVYSKMALKKVLTVIKKKRMKYFLIGAGTNILVGDKGFRGIVLKLEGSYKCIKKIDNYFICGGGLLLKDFVKEASRLGYGGGEFLAGIPGTVGGAIKGNAGAFGHAIADIIEKITVLNKTFKEEEMAGHNIGFDYRRSNLENGVVIIAAQFKLWKRKKGEIVKEIRRIVKQRWQRQPTEYSAGSFFRNPRRCTAGKLIEECGLKGLRIGDAAVSTKHANFIVNLGKAKASDVIKLAALVKQTVSNKKRIRLKEEIKILKY